MKLHDYLWEYIDYQNKNPGLSDLEASGVPPRISGRPGDHRGQQ